MKKAIYSLACCLAAGSLVACGGGQKKQQANADGAQAQTENAMPEYRVLDNPQVNLDEFTKDKDGYYVIFDGKSMKGWRGYGKENVPARWVIEDGCLKFNGSGGGEAQVADGGDLIFSHKFKNFELEFEWKISKGGNSGILYLAQEVMSKDKDGNEVLEPIYISAPEYQLLDNENHPPVGFAVRHDSRQTAERKALRRMEQG